MPNPLAKKIACLLLALLCLTPMLCRAAAAPASSPATQPAVTDLYLASAPQRFWIAEVLRTSSGASATTVWRRESPQKPWRAVAEIPAGVVSFAASNDRVAALLDNGSWQYVGIATGQRPPQGAELLQLASDGDVLWSIARVPSPTTAPAAGEQDAPLPPGLALFKLERGDWQFAGALPDETQRLEPSSLSLGIVAHAPTLAASGNDKTLRWWQLSDGKWSVRSSITLAAVPQHLRVFECGARPAFWVAPAGGLGEIHFPGHKPAFLPLTGAADAADVREFDGYVRLVYSSGGVLHLQRYNAATLLPDGTAEELKVLRGGEEPAWMRWTQGLILSLLVLVLASTFFRNRERLVLKLDWKKVRIAPLPRRIGAGLIDALPYFIGLGWIASHYPDMQIEDLARNPELLAPNFIMSAIYVFYVLLCEVTFGRSVGKMLTGLQVVRFDGMPASRWQLFVRNFLRVIDVGMGVTLLLVALLPLRQRLGDVAAGTLVIMPLPDKPEDAAD